VAFAPQYRKTEGIMTEATAGNLIPISDEQAKAIQEALKTLQGLGSFLRETLGTVPADVVGLLGGDYLKVRRAENLSKIIGKAKERLEKQGVKTEPPSLPLLLPILTSAADEDRDELQEIWVGLLASAADPARNKAFRLKFIEIAKQLDPIDVKVLNKISSSGGSMNAPTRQGLVDGGLNGDEIQISLNNLTELGLLGNPGNWVIYPLGKELLKAVQ
jgi:hypothetical protein